MNKYNEIIKAYKNGYAIPQFNTINAEYTRYILEECEKEKSPVILGVSEKVAKHLGGFKVAKNIVDGLIEDLNITIPVILHLDHAKSKEACEKAIKAGFDSIMIDYSSHTLEENIKITKSLVEENPNTIIECEVGTIGKNGNEGIIYSNLEDIEKIKRETNAHLIAPSFGTVHGVYKGEPKLNFNLLEEIKNKIDTPLVMHGGSYVPDDVRKAHLCRPVFLLPAVPLALCPWQECARRLRSLPCVPLPWRRAPVCRVRLWARLPRVRFRRKPGVLACARRCPLSFLPGEFLP